MSYQPLPEGQEYQPFFSRQYFFENPEFREEHESYMDNVQFSESDGYIDVPLVHSVPSHDIQELYMRKPIPSTSRVAPSTPHRGYYFNGNQPILPKYMRDMKPRLPPHLKVTYAAQGVPRGSPTSYQANADVSENMMNYQEYRIPSENNNCFRSSSTIPIRTRKPVNNRVNVSNSVPMNVKPIVKSSPVTCKTSRYIHRPVLPVPPRKLTTASEPFSPQSKTIQRHQDDTSDVNQPRMSKSQDIEIHNEHQADTLMSRTLPELSREKNTVGVKKMNSEGDATGNGPCDDQLDTIERIVENLDENEAEELSDEHKEEIKRLSKFLIPRVPSSVKALKQKQQEVDEESNGKNEGNDDLAENCTVSFKQSLNSILDQLENCEISLKAVKSKYSMDNKMSQKDVQEEKKIGTKSVEIFNLKDISDRMSPKIYEKNGDSLIPDQSGKPAGNPRKKDVPGEIKSQENSFSSLDSKNETKTSLDDLSALELHRSKSYIVGLIDRALSKELGTIPEDRIDEFKDMSPTKVIKQLTRNCIAKDKTPIKTVARSENNKIATRPEFKDSQSSLSNDTEPSYIKQLKELRWGHFRHIQQEVRRLEDLERFLDNCSAPCPSTY